MIKTPPKFKFVNPYIIDWLSPLKLEFGDWMKSLEDAFAANMSVDSTLL